MSGDPLDLPVSLFHRSHLFRLVIGLAWVAVLSIYVVSLAPITSSHDDSDFNHLWLAGRMIVTGHANQLYDPVVQEQVYRLADPEGKPPKVWHGRYDILGCFNYPPPAALLYVLFAWLPFAQGAVLNAYFNLALILLVAWWIARFLLDRASWIVVSLALLVFPPFFGNLAIGQNAVVTTAILVGGWALAHHRRDFAAGLLWGLMAYKPQWFVAVAWIPLLHGRWRMLAGMAIATVVLFGGSALLIGTRPFFDYVEQFQRVSRIHEMPNYQLFLQFNALSVFRKWFGIGSWATAVGWLSAAIVGVTTAWATWRRWKPATPAFHDLMSCSLLAALWINPHLNFYDLLVVAPCVLVLVRKLRELPNRSKWSAIGCVLICYGIMGWVVENPKADWAMLFPLPSFLLVGLWGLFVYRMRSSARSTLSQTGTPATTSSPNRAEFVSE